MTRMQHRGVAVAAFVLVALGGQSALGQTVYRWTDEQGVVHFADSPPPQRKDVQKQDMPRGVPIAAPEAAADAPPPAGGDAPRAGGPAHIVLTKHEETGVAPAVQSFTGTVKNDGGAEATEVSVALRVVEPNSGDECIVAEIEVEPSTLAPGAKGTFDADFESPCFKGPTRAELNAVWR